MKKDENVFQRWDRRGASGASLHTAGFQPYVAQRLLSRWFDSLTSGMMTSLPVWELLCPPSPSTSPSMHVWIVVSTSSTCAVGKVLYLVQEFFLLHPSGRRICISQPTDLDIITSEREITLVEQLALLAICRTSAHFMAVCGPEIQSTPLPSPGSKFVYVSIRWCVFQRI